MCKLGGYQYVCPVPTRVLRAYRDQCEKNTDLFPRFRISTTVLLFPSCLCILPPVSGFYIFRRVVGRLGGSFRSAIL